MEFENFKDFKKELSPEIKLMVPFTLLLLLLSYWLRELDDNFLIASLLSLIFVLLIDYFVIVPKKFPNVWNMIKWLTLALIILLTLIG